MKKNKHGIEFTSEKSLEEKVLKAKERAKFNAKYAEALSEVFFIT
jgi:hypothetical protein